MRRLRPSQGSALAAARDEIVDEEDWVVSINSRDEDYRLLEKHKEDDRDKVKVDIIKVNSALRGVGMTISLYGTQKKGEPHWMSIQEIRTEVRLCMEHMSDKC